MLVVVLAAATGCARQSSPGTTLTPGERRSDPAQSLVGLDSAVAEINRTRSDLLKGAAAVTAAATALDAADEASASGARDRARTARATVRSSVPAAEAAIAAGQQRAADYRAALQALQQARSALPPDVMQALAAVSAAGEAEAAALEDFGASARRAWPAYAALDDVQARWLERVGAGWYRSEDEAADAYAVLVRPQREALIAARKTLRRADEARRPATERLRQALASADAELEPLRAAS